MFHRHGHKFEIFTLVSEIHENDDLVLGIYNIFKLEVISTQENHVLVFKKVNTIFWKEQVILKPRVKRLMKIEKPFIDDISGLFTVKMLDKKV